MVFVVLDRRLIQFQIKWLHFLLADRIIGYWRNPVVRLSVCDAVHAGFQGWCGRLTHRAKSCTSVFLAGMFLGAYLSLRHLCCRMYRLATKRTTKNELKKTRA